MLVKHLIRELQKCDPEAEVIAEGCDCVGFSWSVSRMKDGSVQIDRNFHEQYDNKDNTPFPLEAK